MTAVLRQELASTACLQISDALAVQLYYAWSAVCRGQGVDGVQSS